MQEDDKNPKRGGWNKGKRYHPYKRLTQEQKELIYRLYEEKMELRKIARTLGVQLRTVQYHLQKNCGSIGSFMNFSSRRLKKRNWFSVIWSSMNSIHNVGKKRRRYYVWTALAVTSTGKKFYFYLLSKEK